MRQFLTAILLCLLTAGTAQAGAWMRDKGTGFSAISTTVHLEDSGAIGSDYSLYFEWGLRDRLTIGLDAHEYQGLAGHALLFARLPVLTLDHGGRLAAEVGIGAYHKQSETRAMTRLKLSYGRGFRIRNTNGWLAVDAGADFLRGRQTVGKLDITAGLSSERRINPLVQIETSKISGAPLYWSVTPSIMITPRKWKAAWVVGIEKNSAISLPGLKLAVWQSF